MATGQIRLQKNQVRVGDRSETSSVDVAAEFTVDGVRVVQFASDDPEWIPRGRNVMGFDADGNRLWTVEAGKDGYEGDFELRRDDDGRLLCLSWKHDYELDPETGELRHLNMHR